MLYYESIVWKIGVHLGDIIVVKKIISIVLLVVFAMSLAACSNSTNTKTENKEGVYPYEYQSVKKIYYKLSVWAAIRRFYLFALRQKRLAWKSMFICLMKMENGRFIAAEAFQ